ncbi:hypothetical protein GCM10010106_36000 [Thermopolyspora flexuosa]|jgi:hypothetical protein|uniref:Uncharacterized protein n=1 Tax=Thermopolyspora flexuosa TaxID=103836 RepID=A0A543J1F5_9ACTN|nr:hypothetical protein [Thermopolyspora flexuosa]TQM76653.1 hypothetical protein FHX40_3398 [Thermopolyspora flexuosa]GGM85776.1 hypothetical protein GCM10010106_36000 [Thermopolyspora flexuosa]
MTEHTGEIRGRGARAGGVGPVARHRTGPAVRRAAERKVVRASSEAEVTGEEHP